MMSLIRAGQVSRAALPTRLYTATISASPRFASSSSSSSGDPNKTKASTSQGSRPKDSKDNNPTVYDPGPAPEDQSEDVKKHNEEMSQRYDRAVNQLNEEGKVEKDFWKKHTKQ